MAKKTSEKISRSCRTVNDVGLEQILPDGERRRRAARDGEKRSDRQIEQAGKKVGIRAVDLAAEAEET